jgi:hypothetical protein
MATKLVPTNAAGSTATAQQAAQAAAAAPAHFRVFFIKNSLSGFQLGNCLLLQVT